ncbi:enoyl-CoA hydratase [Kutzneria sp. 744]|uniref:enoyl-CoA hydratase n=1 Tax=Kutzneria sp. (strain 744) TaxID=345341 RepID=UPI0003EEAF1F|nr:enoyl-CoA hydratase [Kutzneria sp. 744]EWM15495.1 enoyl-CoA hydratase FadB1x [Kutzneria sp. 744]
MSQILVDRRDRVAVLTVHDPDRRNALNLALATELAEAVRACEADEETGAIVVTGTSPAFCAGADLTALGEAREQGLRDIYAGFLAVANCSLPTVAAVNGAAVGAGLNLALACDVRLAGARAKFDARFLQLGIHPGGGMTWMLQRIVGPQQAAAMTLFSQVYDAQAALRAGLVLDVVEDVVEQAVQLAAKAADAPRDLVIATKRTMRATAAADAHADAVELEIRPQLESIDSPAFAERLAALRRRISSN